MTSDANLLGKILLERMTAGLDLKSVQSGGRVKAEQYLYLGLAASPSG